MLIDRFNRPIEYLRISLIDKCDLRCTYCIPEGFTEFEHAENYLSFDDIERVVAAFARLGTSRFRLTGGEPLLRKNVVDLVARLSSLEGVDDLSMSTNATQLARFAQPLKDAGLNRFNISLDSLNPEIVKKISGSDSLSKVLESLKAVKAAGFENTKINMVPLLGINTQDIEQMIGFCKENGFTLRLIEVMPMGSSGQSLDYVDLQEVIENTQNQFNLIESKRVHGGGPARYWETADGSFSLGFITPRSQHFCETCNRVRMTADGVLHLCLGQNDSFDLKPYLQAGCSDEELEEAIKLAIELKPEKHEFNEKPEQIIRIMAKTGG